jgi:hypothetical protein
MKFKLMKFKLRRLDKFFTIWITILFALVSSFISTSAAQTVMERGHDHTVTLSIEGEEWSAILKESDVTRNFIKSLPLYITLKDYEDSQKVSGLPTSLRVGSSPAGSDASAGDIAYYAPWDNLVIFYEDVQYTKGLVIMGYIDDNLESFLEILKTYEAVDVRIDLVE